MYSLCFNQCAPSRPSHPCLLSVPCGKKLAFQAERCFTGREIRYSQANLEWPATLRNRVCQLNEATLSPLACHKGLAVLLSKVSRRGYYTMRKLRLTPIPCSPDDAFVEDKSATDTPSKGVAVRPIPGASFHGESWYNCPTCGNSFEFYSAYHNGKRCQKCGQLFLLS